MLLIPILLVVVFFIISAIYIYKIEKSIKHNINCRNTVNITYWKNYFISNKHNFDEQKVISVLKLLGNTFDVDCYKLRHDDKLNTFDWTKSGYIHLFGDSLLDNAIEELICENILPETIKKDSLNTIGDIILLSNENGKPRNNQ